MTKEYPLTIEPIQEFESSNKTLWYVSKGHHGFEEFCDALREWNIYAGRYDIRHTYWRRLPDGSSMECKQDRGAIPMTVLDMEASSAKIIAPIKVRLADVLPPS